MASTTLVSAEEFLKLPDDGCRHELVRGEVISMPPAGLDHGDDATDVAYFLKSFVRQHSGGRVVVEVGFTLWRNPDTVRAPDVAFIAESRLPPPGERSGYFDGAPDIAVEIVSPGDTAAEVEEKVQEYLSAGSRLVWVVRRRTRTVSVYRANGTVQTLGAADHLSGEDVLPGFTLAVRDIFA